MFLALPINEKNLFWTRHSKEKMRQYGFSENRLKRVLRRPERKEEGVAPNTVAVMQGAGTKKHPIEIWLMYQVVRSKSDSKKSKIKQVRIVSAWKYPGKSPVGKMPPIPEDVLSELEKLI